MSATVIALAAEHGEWDQPSPFALTVTVHWRLVDLFAMRLSRLGCAGMRVTVRTPRPLSPPTVHQLAEARVARLTLTHPVEAATLVTWVETAKAAASAGLPLVWHGLLPADVRRHALHLPPPTDDGRWLAGWRYGMLGWRRGPGFAEVLDRRRGHRRTVVDLGVLTKIFGEGLDCPSVFTSTAAELVEAGLAMSVQGEIVWLPYRLKASSRAGR